ncbi:cobalt ABC transporter permease [Roseibium alexandrii]|uniref:cobalt ABC transporter permease n=1 Tax=Roseibium alexandrii TaxID=388408 RepID=UPI003750846A
MKHAPILAFLLLCCGHFATQPAFAHKVIASVFASGSTIQGEIGFSSGDMAIDTLVEVFDGDGNKLGETKTDEAGFFSFSPTQRVVHVFRANLGSGHVTEVRMELDELPDVIDKRQDDDGGTESAPVIEYAASFEEAVPSISSSAVAQLTKAALEENRELVREMIHQEITPLRREIAAYKEKNDLQTILGGIGYIAGLFGLLFYIAARRKLARG